MMRTTLTIDDSQVENLMQITGQKSAVSAIRQALDDYLRESRRKQVLALRGKVQIADNWRELRALEVDRDLPKGRNA
jgi:hypothetical protein